MRQSVACMQFDVLQCLTPAVEPVRSTPARDLPPACQGCACLCESLAESHGACRPRSAVRVRSPSCSDRSTSSTALLCLNPSRSAAYAIVTTAAFRRACYLQQKLMLLRMKSRVFCCTFAKVQKAAQLKTEVSQSPEQRIMTYSDGLRNHIYIVSRYTVRYKWQSSSSQSRRGGFSWTPWLCLEARCLVSF